MNKAEDILSTSLATLQDRAKLRDNTAGERSMEACVLAFNALTGNELTTLDGWKFMLCLKMSRSRHGKFHLDDYVDMVGYAALAGEEATREAGFTDTFKEAYITGLMSGIG